MCPEADTLNDSSMKWRKVRRYPAAPSLMTSYLLIPAASNVRFQKLQISLKVLECTPVSSAQFRPFTREMTP